MNKGSAYLFIYRIELLICALSLLSTNSAVNAIGAVTGDVWFTELLKGRYGLIAVCIACITCEALLYLGRCTGQTGLFTGALIFITAAAFFLLMRFELHLYVLTVFLCMILMHLICRFKALRLLFTLTAAALSFFVIPGGELLKVGMISLMCLIIFGITELLYADFTVWIPYGFILSVLLMLFPVSEKPFDWSFLSRFANAAERSFDSAVASLNYYLGDLGITDINDGGYNGLGRVAGKVGGNVREELKLYGGWEGSLYINGAGLKRLDKDGWKERVTSSLPYNGWFITYLDALYKNGVTRDEVKSFSQTEKLMIEYEYIKTSDMLHPLQPLIIEKSARDKMTKDKSDFRFIETEKKGTSYGITYLELDYANPLLKSILRISNDTGTASFEELSKYCYELYGFELDHYLSKEDYKKYTADLQSEKADEALLSADMATERMKELAHSVTKGFENDYDKAKAIEAYLRQYHYSTDTDYIKADNFVDSFLFEKQKGYCVHYASAMVMLLRLNGIPSRYVEGYAAGFYKEKSGKETVLKGDSSHAWAEAYIDGFGWVRFEPTPVKPVSEDTGWGRLSLSEIDAKKEKAYVIPKRPVPVQDITEPEELKEEQPDREKYYTALRIAVYMLLLLAAYFILYFILRLIISRIRYLRKDDAGKLIIKMDRIKSLIERTYSGEWENAPLREYRGVLKGELKELSEDVFNGYYVLRFSGNNTGGNMKDIRLKAEILDKLLSSEYVKYGKGHFKRVRSIL
ncbi:MAG: transglutaminase domain-containing protein [Lachnospiraceae bacterium]|nr:transglutaminase domain-containing protein [Lachnospiraceae bacterium]